MEFLFQNKIGQKHKDLIGLELLHYISRSDLYYKNRQAITWITIDYFAQDEVGSHTELYQRVYELKAFLGFMTELCSFEAYITLLSSP